jgi:ribonucleoside-diphosphate reductase beta chain
VASPDDLPAKVRFVTIYHLILESTLGLTSFRFITDHLKREELLPGFVEGYSKIHDDETRHIAYGVWFLREAVRGSGEAGRTVRETLAEFLPVVAESLTPPDRDGDVDWKAFGADAADIREFALNGLTRRLDIIGTPLQTTA